MRDYPVIRGKTSPSSLDELITGAVLKRRTGKLWLFSLLVTFLGLNLFLFAITYLFAKGVGIWGLNIPAAWAFDITNFVWWIGIGHAGTLISAILLLLHQEWRTSINRFAEAMTLFAVACAAMFPLLHLGRPWYLYWLLPYPDTMNLWPQWRSPLIWDVFAVTTYGTISLIFWYIGMLPDLASLRDRSSKPGLKRIYGVMSFGWRGSAVHWDRYQTAYLLLAGLATPLVVSVHSVVSMDFTAGIVPGWHSTIFPPYFVAGAIFSGFAMVLSLGIPLRKFLHLKDVITERHLDNSAKLLLATGLIVAYGYVMENFMAWYSGNKFERFIFLYRVSGREAVLGWAMYFFNVALPQLLWFRRVRVSPTALFLIAALINVGMWLERYMIVVTSISRDFLPSSWGNFTPTFWDIATLTGTLALFFFLFLLFVRALPVVAIFELKELAHKKTTETETREEPHARGTYD